MRILKSLTFIFLVVGVFIYYYKRSSHKSRLKRFTASLRLAIIVATASANLIGNPQSVNAVENSSTPVLEQVRSNQEEVVNSETIDSNKLNERTKNSDIALELRGGDFPIASPKSLGINDPKFKVDPNARGHKSGPGARGRARGRAAAQTRAAKGKSNGLGISAYATPHQGFCRYHGPEAQSCLIRKAHSTPFDPPTSSPPSRPPSAPGQGPGQYKYISPPPGSEYKYGLSPFKGVFKYNPNFSSDKMDFNDQKSMGHMFDNYSKKALNIPENKNKQSLQKMENKLVQFMNESDTVCLQGSYSYKRPAYLFVKPVEKRSENNLIFAVDANTNRPITTINGTAYQFSVLDQPDHNLGKDRRSLNPAENCNSEDQSLGSITLRLRGPQYPYY